MIALLGSAALLGSYLLASLFSSNFIKRYVLAFTVFISYASVSGLIGIVGGADSARVWVFVSTVALLAFSVFLLRRKPQPIWGREGIYLLLFMAIVLVSQMVTRLMRLSSIAFTDGQTILVMGLSIQAGEPESLEGTQALKRGFALPTMHALGNEGEYFVGLMPLFFLAALGATYIFAKRYADSRRVAVYVTGTLAGLSLATESILRHVYLINTHAITWMLIAAILAVFVSGYKNALGKWEITILIASSAAIGFLRVDYIFLFAPLTLIFLIFLLRESKVLAAAYVFAQAIPASIWTFLYVEEFPVFGVTGPFLITVFAAIGYLLALALRSWLTKFGYSQVYRKTITFWLFGLLAALLLNSQFVESIRRFFINTFVGEGLWGVTAILLTAIAVISFLAGGQGVDRRLSRAILNIALALALAYLFTKFYDGYLAGRTFPNLVRIGWGDTLNRALVMFLPFFVLPLTKLLVMFDRRLTRKA